MPNEINFSGSIPQNYDDYLTKFLFDGFAEDIVKRLTLTGATNVLELASGTGCVTRQLLKRLPATAILTATDLQAGMLEVAKKNLSAANIVWATVDMTDIPYGENLFDSIICQFGIMLVPEKLRALTEMFRVLKPGGQLVFNVWGNIEDNAIWNIGGKVIGAFLANNPIVQDPGPFSMNEGNTMQLLKDAGFANITSSIINQTGKIETAAMAAKGFIKGLPVVLAISKSNPSLIPQIQQALENELTSQLGNHPLRSPLQALVFEANK